jgi:hypothetical protein
MERTVTGPAKRKGPPPKSRHKTDAVRMLSIIKKQGPTHGSSHEKRKRMKSSPLPHGKSNTKREWASKPPLAALLLCVGE